MENMAGEAKMFIAPREELAQLSVLCGRLHQELPVSHQIGIRLRAAKSGRQKVEVFTNLIL